MSPVRVGRTQAPALGVALAAWDGAGRPVTGEQGELVVTAPLPSMPLYFVNDPGDERYRAGYFDVYPGVWRHGDWVTVEPDLSVVVAGRSDSTLSLVIGAEMPDGQYFMPLFVVLAEDATLDDRTRRAITTSIRQQLSPRHVPDTIVPIAAVPRTLTGKKLEVPVKRLLQGAALTDVSAEGATIHPEMLTWFADFATGFSTRGVPHRMGDH